MLVGDRFIKIQGVVIPTISAGIGVAIAVRPRWDEMSSALACLLLIFAGIMVLATVRYGRYYLRDPERDVIAEGKTIQGESGPRE